MVTLKDVAERAGVTVTTVSRASIIGDTLAKRREKKYLM